MNRRSFLAALAGAMVLDPERLLWRPGAKLISTPKPNVLDELNRVTLWWCKQNPDNLMRTIFEGQAFEVKSNFHWEAVDLYIPFEYRPVSIEGA